MGALCCIDYIEDNNEDNNLIKIHNKSNLNIYINTEIFYKVRVKLLNIEDFNSYLNNKNFHIIRGIILVNLQEYNLYKGDFIEIKLNGNYRPNIFLQK